MAASKIILFGGTFDPIHLGHTAVAAAARENIDADKVVFVPAKRSPLKAFFPEASDDDRLAMINSAISGNNAFDVTDYELKKPGLSYTLATVRYFRQQSGDKAHIYWLIGADTLEDLPHWYGITELIDECNLAVMHRAGFPPPDFSRFQPLWGLNRVTKMRQNVVETPLVDISSTEIRKRLKAGRDISKMVCPEVEQYIREHGLYGARND